MEYAYSINEAEALNIFAASSFMTEPTHPLSEKFHRNPICDPRIYPIKQSVIHFPPFFQYSKRISVIEYGMLFCKCFCVSLFN